MTKTKEFYFKELGMFIGELVRILHSFCLPTYSIELREYELKIHIPVDHHTIRYVSQIVDAVVNTATSFALVLNADVRYDVNTSQSMYNAIEVVIYYWDFRGNNGFLRVVRSRTAELESVCGDEQ